MDDHAKSFPLTTAVELSWPHIISRQLKSSASFQYLEGKPILLKRKGVSSGARGSDEDARNFTRFLHSSCNPNHVNLEDSILKNNFLSGLNAFHSSRQNNEFGCAWLQSNACVVKVNLESHDRFFNDNYYSHGIKGWQRTSPPDLELVSLLSSMGFKITTILFNKSHKLVVRPWPRYKRPMSNPMISFIPEKGSLL
ncbi:hypothetical protein VNO77_44005 [Canavalia gladiata]|uniref:Uncharacterized protein n=1 Tax=Canavalia gladiata TaxID=3824 RepID=A0AAN9JV89_CANGL